MRRSRPPAFHFPFDLSFPTLSKGRTNTHYPAKLAVVAAIALSALMTAAIFDRATTGSTVHSLELTLPPLARSLGAHPSPRSHIRTLRLSAGARRRTFARPRQKTHECANGKRKQFPLSFFDWRACWLPSSPFGFDLPVFFFRGFY